MTNEEREKHIRTANMLIGEINDLIRPILMYQIEKDVTKEALENYIKMLEQQPCEYGIAEFISEFDKKHPALFADYMRDFNNHPISEIIDYMWDMHDLIGDIKYRLPNAESEDKE